ncbi:MAG: DUF4321 domain-containing protein, partial [Akkermansia muciniphila]
MRNETKTEGYPYKMKHKLSFLQILVLLIGAVLGSLIAKMAAGASGLSWLAFGQSFGLSTTTLDLGIFTLTFGFTMSITVATILGL